MDENRVVTLANVLTLVEQAGLAETRRRDTVSAIKRICEMAGTAPVSMLAQPPVLREMLAKVRPAAHGVTAKSFSNMKSLFAAALQTTGVIEPLGRGRAKRDGQWGPLLEIVADDPRLSNGLATFANWCAAQSIPPDEVNDAVVQRFRLWLESKTLHPKPRDLVRAAPKMWNEASGKFDSWPTTKLTKLSFKGPAKHLKWSDLSPLFQQDADAYLALRANPDLFDERPEAARRPLAATTLRQQREHLRLAASILTQNGEGPASLADLVKPERFKAILRHYHNKAKGGRTPSSSPWPRLLSKWQNTTPAQRRRKWMNLSV